MILRRGSVVEMGATERVFGNPLHPYTKMLLASVPQLHTKWRDARGRAGAPRPVTNGSRPPRGGAVSSSRSRTTTSSRRKGARRREGRAPERSAGCHGRRAREHPVGGAPAGRRATSSGARAATRSSRATRSRARTASSTPPSSPSATASPGVFRVDDTRRMMNLHAGRSDDGVDWEIDARADRVRAGRRPSPRDPGARSTTPTTRASPGSRIATT